MLVLTSFEVIHSIIGKLRKVLNAFSLCLSHSLSGDLSIDQLHISDIINYLNTAINLNFSQINKRYATKLINM